MTTETIESKARLLEASWNWALTQVFFAVIRKYAEFSADEVFKEARESKAEIPPVYISQHIGAFFRSFKASGHITKTGSYKLSERNGSSPLPIYKGVKSDVVSKGK
jgi:hypothetical protein